MQGNGAHAEELDGAKGTRAWLWPVSVVGILGVSMMVCAVTVVAAVGDPSYAIEDDYYQKAVEWDEARRMQDASHGLGWTADVSITTGNRLVSVIMNDTNGKPIEGAAVRATVFHHARRGMAEELVLQHRGGGQYAATLTHPREGQWQVRLSATIGRSRFLHTEDLWSSEVAP